MPDLTKSQKLILEAAATRPDGAILPLPPGLTLRGAARKAALAGLVARGVAAERPAKDSDLAWRQDDGKQFTLQITPKGHAALKNSIASNGPKPTAEISARKKAATATRGKRPRKPGRKPVKSRPATKRDRLIAALQRDKGATIAELQKALAWQPHSVRAALTGLRKQGHQIDRSGRVGASRYRITATNRSAQS